MYADQSEDLRQARTQSARGQAAMIKNYQRTFGTDVGRLVLKDLVTRFFLKNTAVAGDPHTTYFLEGQRMIVLHLLDQLKMNVDEVYDKLLTQANTDTF